jgi:hypothetical protein
MERSTFENKEPCSNCTFHDEYEDDPGYSRIQHITHEYDGRMFITKITTETYHDGRLIGRYSISIDHNPPLPVEWWKQPTTLELKDKYSEMAAGSSTSRVGTQVLEWYPNHIQLQTKTAPALKNSKMAIALGLVPSKKSHKKRS